MQFGVMWCCFEAKCRSLEWFLLKIGPPRKPAIVRGAKPSACGHTLISSASCSLGGCLVGRRRTRGVFLFEGCR